MPKVSVIIPVYNSASYLEECLNSVYAQSLDDYEIICVDDGSTASSGDILDLQAEKGRIRLIRQSHKGVSAARNTGLAAACGDYVYFMDSDDTMLPGLLEKVSRRAEQDSLDVTLFNGIAWSEQDEFKKTAAEQNAFMNRSHRYEGVYSGGELMVLMYENHEYWMTQWLQLYSRKFLEKNKLTFQEGIIHEDNLFSFICMLTAGRCGYVDEVFYRKRIRPDSITTSKLSFDNTYGYFICHLQMKNFLISRGSKGNNPAAESIMYDSLDSARRTYSRLNRSERLRYLSLPYEDQVLFKTLIADYMGGVESRTVAQEEKPEKKPASAEAGEVRKPQRLWRKLLNRLLPSSRYNVAWSYQHLTEQAQSQVNMLSSLMSSVDGLNRQLADLGDHYWRSVEKQESGHAGNTSLFEINYNIQGITRCLEGLMLDNEIRSRRVEYSRTPDMDGITCLKKAAVEKPPYVSVIVPLHNVNQHLRECMDSLIGQTLENIEIICIDDNSDDGSLKTALEFAERDSRISVYIQKHAGLSVMQNRGVCFAQGTWLYFVEGDCVLDINGLEILLNKARQEEVELLFCGASAFSTDDKYREEAEELDRELIRRMAYGEVSDGKFLFTQMVRNGDYKVPYWMQFIRRDFFIRSSLWFIEENICDDNAFTFRNIVMARRVVCIPDRIYKHRVRGSEAAGFAGSFEGVYSLFVNYLGMMNTFKDVSLSYDEQAAFQMALQDCAEKTFIRYEALDEPEKRRLFFLTETEKKLFEINILDRFFSVDKSAQKLLEKVDRVDAGPLIRELEKTGTISNDLLKKAVLLSDPEEILKHMPQGGTAVEIGVGYGEVSDRIISILKPVHFYGVDTFLPKDGLTASSTEAELNRQRWYKKHFEALIPGQMTVCCGAAAEVLKTFPDDKLDYIYINSDDNYKVFKELLELVKLKVKAQGMIHIANYTLWDPFRVRCCGAIPAVNAFVNETKSQILYYCMSKYHFDEIVLCLSKTEFN